MIIPRETKRMKKRKKTENVGEERGVLHFSFFVREGGGDGCCGCGYAISLGDGGCWADVM